MIKSPLSEDLGSSPCLALITARVPMARCWSHAIGDLCLSVQVTLNRPDTKFPRTLACAEVGREPFCVGHGHEISETACMRGVLGGTWKFYFGYNKKTARTTRLFARASPLEAAMVRLEFGACISPRQCQPTLEHKRDAFFLGRMLEPLPKPMDNWVLAPLEPCESPKEAFRQIPVIASRILVLSDIMRNGTDGLKRSAVRELHCMADMVPPAAVVSAGGDAALCVILRRAVETLGGKHQPHGRLSTDVAVSECQHLRQAFAALAAVARGERSSPPVWTTHARMLPAIRAALDALAATDLNGVLAGSAACSARVAALREGASLFDALYRQMLMDKTEAAHAASMGYSLPLPPSGSRLGWVDGAGLANRLPILIDRGVPLLPPVAPSRVTRLTTPVPHSPRRHALPRRPLPTVRPTNANAYM